MIELRDKTTDECLGTSDDDELQFLIGAREGEWAGSPDHPIAPSTIRKPGGYRRPHGGHPSPAVGR